MNTLIIDDDPITRHALKNLLLKCDSTFELTEAGCCSDALEILNQKPIDLILLDLGLPDSDDLHCFQRLQRHPNVPPIIIISRLDDPDLIHRAFKEGLRGYICKSVEPHLLLPILALVTQGGYYIPKELLKLNDTPPTLTRHKSLTPGQQRVLEALAIGYSNRQIAEALECNEKTIRNRMTEIMKALNVRNRTEAVIAAQQLKLLKKPIG